MNDCARHCCVCRRYKGIKIEVHHLVPEASGGPNTYENAIPLCFDCHSDAGHYNERHSKGTKFSVPELKKARDTWYELVRNNSIIEKVIVSKDIQTTYYVLHSFDVLEAVLGNDFSSVNKYRKGVYLSNNLIVTEWLEIIRSHKEDYSTIDQSVIIETGEFNSLEEYRSIYSSAELTDKSGTEYPYYEAERKSNWESVVNSVEPNSFLKKLSKSGIKAEMFCTYLLHKNHDSCGANEAPSGYTEYLQIAPISFVFLGVTNASREQIKLNGLLTSHQKLIKLPDFHLLPLEMVLIPIATAINLPKISDNSIVLEHSGVERGQDFSRVVNNVGFSDDVIYFKKGLALFL